LVLLDEFKRAGAMVEFVTTPSEDTPEGRLLLKAPRPERVGRDQHSAHRHKRPRAGRARPAGAQPGGPRWAPRELQLPAQELGQVQHLPLPVHRRGEFGSAAVPP